MKIIYRITPMLLSLMLIGCAANPAQNAPAQHSPAASGHTLAPAGAGFTVNMPGKPDESTAANGTHLFTVEIDGIAYLASYADVDNSELTPAQLDRVLDTVARGEARKGGKLLSMKKISRDGHNGRDLTIGGKGGLFMHARFTVVRARMFQVIAVTTMEHANAPEITHFLDSFHVTWH